MSPSGGVCTLLCKPDLGEPGTNKSLIAPGIFLIFLCINPSSGIGFLFSSKINLPSLSN